LWQLAARDSAVASGLLMLDPQTSRFWRSALLSELMDAEALKACWDAIIPAKRTAPEHIDRRLARQAVQLKALTLWQAQQLLAGRTGGFKVDRYILLDLIGQGGMGRVYLARDARLNRRVALKILSPERISNPRAIARFQREARVGAQLQHENLVRIYDFGESNDRHYLVMEYIEGKTIGTLISEQGPMSPQSAVQLVRQVALGLDHAHGKGLIHRDVNPFNILVTRDGTAKLADLGLAMDLTDEGHVTREGATVGTFDYVAPEQARHSHAADIRSDIYSLGCTLYHMCTGQVPFPSPSLPEKLFAHQAVEPTPVDQLVPGLPQGLAEVIDRMMRKTPDDRYATPMQVVEALEPYTNEPSVSDTRIAGAAFTQQLVARNSVFPPQSTNAEAAALRQGTTAGPTPGLIKTVAVPDAAEVLLPTETESASAASSDKPSAAQPSPVTTGHTGDVDRHLLVNLGPELRLREELLRSKPRSTTGRWLSAARSAPPRKQLGLFWSWGLALLTTLVITAIVIVATFNSSSYIRNKPALAVRKGRTAQPKLTSKVEPAIIVRAEGENDQGFAREKLHGAIQAAMGARGWVELQTPEPLRLDNDQSIDLSSAQGVLIVRAAAGVIPIVELDMKVAKKPLIVTGSSVSLEMSGLTFVVHYPDLTALASPSFIPGAVIAAAGSAKIDRCAFKVAGGSYPRGSCALSFSGGSLEVKRCWFQGYDKAIDVDAMSRSPALIQQTMIVPASRPTSVQTQAPALYGWAMKLQLTAGGGMLSKPSHTHVVLENCTVEGTGLLDLTANQARLPLEVDVRRCVIGTDTLLAYNPRPDDESVTSQLHWRGDGNQYGVRGSSWIMRSGSDGGLKHSTNVTDLASWLKFVAGENHPIRAPVTFKTNGGTRMASYGPYDFSVETTGPLERKPGADPERVGPWSNP
jgi:serine/threonine-protein kinase